MATTMGELEIRRQFVYGCQNDSFYEVDEYAMEGVVCGVWCVVETAGIRTR